MKFRKGTIVPFKWAEGNLILFGVDVEIIGGIIYPIEDMKKGESIFIAKNLKEGFTVDIEVRTAPKGSYDNIEKYHIKLNTFRDYEKESNKYKKLKGDK